MILDRHYWWTADRKRVVPDGHPESAFLAFARGHEVADMVCRQFGIPVPGDDEPDEPESEEPEEKAKPSPANKARARPAAEKDR